MNLRNKIILGDILSTLPMVADEQFDSIITSPPYYGVRDYTIAKTEWPEIIYEIMPGFGPVTVPAETCCLGLEKNFVSYIGHLVHVFRLARRTLKKTGTLWVNMGDSHCSNGASYGNGKSTLIGRRHGEFMGAAKRFKKMGGGGIKNKDLFGAPWALAFALRQDGWYLRIDNIWNKTNCQPESAKDRPTKAHEYIFLLSKSKKYYYDHVAIREELKDDTIARNIRAVGNNHKHLDGAPGQPPHSMKREKANGASGMTINSEGANKRSVWTIATAQFKGMHYAVFPIAIPDICIRASTSMHGNCAECGRPWRRVIEKKLVPTAKAGKKFVIDDRDFKADPNDQGSNRQKDGHKNGHINVYTTVGWEATCKCKCTQMVRPLVADIFGGAGTTGLAARNLKVDVTLFEISEKYSEMSIGRSKKHNPLFDSMEIFRYENNPVPSLSV